MAGFCTVTQVLAVEMRPFLPLSLALSLLQPLLCDSIRPEASLSMASFI